MRTQKKHSTRGRGREIVASLLVGIGFLLMTADVIEPASNFVFFVIYPLMIFGGLAMIIKSSKMSGCW